MPTDATALTPTERGTLDRLVMGIENDDTGSSVNRNQAWRLRLRMGARTNAQAVALAYQRGMLETCTPDSWGLLAMMAVRHAVARVDQSPELVPLVVRVLQEHPVPPLRVAADIAHHVREALAGDVLDWEARTHLHHLLAYCDEVTAMHQE